MDFYERSRNFLSKELWEPPKDPLRPLQKFYYRLLRIFVLTLNGFQKDDIYSKSSALTFYTLLSIVPVLAVAFGIAKGFGFDQRLEEEVLVQLREYPDLAHKIIQFSYSTLAQAQGGLIAGVGVILLFYTVFKLLSNIEISLNSIWKATSERPLARKISDYLAAMLLCPFFFIIMSSVNIYITTTVVQVARSYHLLETFSPIVYFFLSCIPYVLSWILFTFIYIFMPNAKVYWKYAVLGGLIAGTSFQIWQWAYINFQVNLSSYSTIYGSFAAIPLFLIWLNVSWMIVLGGAEVAYQAEQDDSNSRYRNKEGVKRVKTNTRCFALLITAKCIENFKEGHPPYSIESLSQLFGVPESTIREIVNLLLEAKILSEIKDDNNEEYLLPARDPSTINVKTVIDAVDPTTLDKISIWDSLELAHLNQALNHYDENVSSASANLSIPEINVPPAKNKSISSKPSNFKN